MTSTIEELQDELQKEISALDLERIRIEERINEKRRILGRLTIAEGRTRVTSLPMRRVNVRKSITALGHHHYEVGGQRFKNPGQLLDHFNVAHYFSVKNPHKKDAAAREILRWAKRNSSQARTVAVVLSNGTKTDLFAAVSRVWP